MSHHMAGTSRSNFPDSSKSAAGAFHIDGCRVADVQHAQAVLDLPINVSQNASRKRICDGDSSTAVMNREFQMPSHQLHASAIRGSRCNVRVIPLDNGRTADLQS